MTHHLEGITFIHDTDPEVPQFVDAIIMFRLRSLLDELEKFGQTFHEKNVLAHTQPSEIVAANNIHRFAVEGLIQRACQTAEVDELISNDKLFPRTLELLSDLEVPYALVLFLVQTLTKRREVVIKQQQHRQEKQRKKLKRRQ